MENSLFNQYIKQIQEALTPEEEEDILAASGRVGSGAGTETFTGGKGLEKLPIFNIATLKEAIQGSYLSKEPLLVYGDPGVGKSGVIRATARQLAHQFKLEYVEVPLKSADEDIPVVEVIIDRVDRFKASKEDILKDYYLRHVYDVGAIKEILQSMIDKGTLTEDPKTKKLSVDFSKPYSIKDRIEAQKGYYVTKIKDIIDNPEKYFVLIDERLSGREPTDIPGIYDLFGPKAREIPWVTTKKLMWAVVATIPGLRGILFLDEINQADEQTLNALYPVVHKDERQIGDLKISSGITVIGAGNLHTERAKKAKLTDIPTALLGRFTEGSGVLVVNAKEWLEWADDNHVHPRIQMFVMRYPEIGFYNVVTSKYENQGTPRNLAALSRSLYRIDSEIINKARQAIDERIEEIKAEHPDWKEEDVRKEAVNLTKMDRSQLIADRNGKYIAKAQYICGTDWASRFGVFIKHIDIFYNWEEIVNDPEAYFKKLDKDPMAKEKEIIADEEETAGKDKKKKKKEEEKEEEVSASQRQSSLDRYYAFASILAARTFELLKNDPELKTPAGQKQGRAIAKLAAFITNHIREVGINYFTSIFENDKYKPLVAAFIKYVLAHEEQAPEWKQFGSVLRLPQINQLLLKMNAQHGSVFKKK